MMQEAIVTEVQQIEDTTLLWSRKDKTLTILIISIKDNLIPIVEDLLDPTEVRQVLKILFESHNATQTLYLINKFHSMRIGGKDLGGRLHVNN
jgi:hypothetical protein